MSRARLLSFRVVATFGILAAPLVHADDNSATDRRAVPVDITVSADGDGDFTTIQAALDSISKSNRERIVILVKNGVYREKIRVDANCVSLVGEDRDGTRIEFTQLADDFNAKPDEIGRAVVNVHGDDFIMQNLTAENTADIVQKHAFTVYGDGDRTVVTDCNVLSVGADTMSLWNGAAGRYYHARCQMRGAVDFICPRGWCFVRDCTFFETKPSAATWHDGSKNRDQKFVLRNCQFDGVPGWYLARRHHDAAFYFLDCVFSQSMIDRAPYRVIYPIGDKEATVADAMRNRQLDKTNRWGERAYFFNCRREGGDYTWHANNLDEAPHSPTPGDITPTWTFAGSWDPERQTRPRATEVFQIQDRLTVVFDERVTVKGAPEASFDDGSRGRYLSGSGTNRIDFSAPESQQSAERLVFDEGIIIASGAAATIRRAEAKLPVD